MAEKVPSVRLWKVRDRFVRAKSRLLRALSQLRHLHKREGTISIKLKLEVDEKQPTFDGHVQQVVPDATTMPITESNTVGLEEELEEERQKLEESESSDQVEDVDADDEASDDSTEPEECGLENVPFVILVARKPSELPEDVERMIFEMVACAFPEEVLKTLVYVNHRIKIWVEYVLYRSVILRDAKHARRFLDGLEMKNPNFIARAVKILSLPTRVSFDTSFQILSACRNIHHLSWLPTNRLPTDILALITGLPLSSLRARLLSFLGDDPDFSNSLFQRLTTLCIADYQDVWKKWTWKGMKTRPNLKWIAVNLDGRLDTFSGWGPVRTIEKTLLKPYGGSGGVRLFVCYHHNPVVQGSRWIHRTKETFSEERMVVLSLNYRIDGERWLERATGLCQDFEISEGLVRERQQEERRLHFALNRSSLVVQQELK